jgi:hypothetical protein
MLGTTRMTAYGYSLWDFSVKGAPLTCNAGDAGTDAGVDAGPL